jgi:hypothetical protein
MMLFTMLAHASPTANHAAVDRRNKVRYISHDGVRSSTFNIHSRNFVNTSLIEHPSDLDE